MRYSYFVVALSYDGKGSAVLRNDVVLRRERISTAAEVARLEEDLDRAYERHHTVVNFVLLAEGRPDGR